MVVSNIKTSINTDNKYMPPVKLINSLNDKIDSKFIDHSFPNICSVLPEELGGAVLFLIAWLVCLTFPYSQNDQYCTYLGFIINTRAFDRNKQTEHNIEKAKQNMQSMTFVGLFKGGLKNEHLIRSFGSNILPILDSFICGAIKNLCGIPKATPNLSVQTIYKFSSFSIQDMRIKLVFNTVHQLK